MLDARGESRFLGATSEPRANMGSGHIPNACNLPFKNVLHEGKMKSISELQVLFDVFDLQNKELIFSCGSGVTACIILLACELVNDNQKTLFDGSWAEWGLNGKFPIS